MSNFTNIRNDGVQKVANAAARLLLLPPDGYLVEQLDDNTIWAWNQASQTWIATGGTDLVTSVFGRIGDVVAQTGDYTAAQVGAVALTGDESVSGIKSFTSYPEGPGTSPTTDAQLVDKAYVDLLVTTGARFVDAVLVATTTPLPANTYNNGVSGVGATLTGNVNGALAAIDGVTPLLNGKYLIKDEATQANNGAYLLTQVGDGSNPYILTRLNDYNESSEIVGGTFFTVIGGSQANQQWAMNNAATITVGTTAITFAQLSVAPTITASLGVQKVGNDVRANLDAAGAITLSGNSMLVNVDNASIERNANALRVKALGVTNAMLAGSIADSKLSTITTAGKVRGSALTILSGIPGAAGVIPVANGSTGNSSYAIGDILYATGATTLSKLGIGSNGKVLGVTAGLPSWVDQTGGGGGGLSTIYYSKSLSTDSTQVTVSNSVTETTLYTYSIPANQLGTDKVLEGLVEGTYLNNSAANRTVRVRVKYGATTILDKTSGNLGTSATSGTFSINFYLANQGANNVQQAYMYCSFESGANVSVDFTDRGVAAIDSTTTQSLVVTVALTNATATQTITKRLATLNMLNAQDDVGGVLLQTDGVDNGLQTTLNLAAGTGINLTDNGTGTVTIDSTGGVVFGDPASGFVNGEIQYIDQSGNQFGDTQFTRDSVTHDTLIGSDIPAAYSAAQDSPSPFVVVADVKGDVGNSISLTFDGVDDVDTVVAAWNAANPSNTVTVASGGISVPDADTITLSGGGQTQFISGSLAGGAIFGSGFQTQDITNNIDNIFATGNLARFAGVTHGNAFFLIDNTNNFLSGILQSVQSNTMTVIDLASFSYFSSIEASNTGAFLQFIDNTTNSGVYVEPNNRVYLKVASNNYIFPTSVGSPGDALSINSQVGQDVQLSWVTPGGGGGSPAGSDTQIQFNNAGAFGAASTFTFDTSTNIFKVQGSNGINLDTLNGVYQFGNLGVNNLRSYFNNSDLNKQMSYIGEVPVFGGIGHVSFGGPNDLSYDSSGYTLRTSKTWNIEIDSESGLEVGLFFVGAGLNDMTYSGAYSGGASNALFKVEIDATGTPDTFTWYKNGISQATAVPITGSAQLLDDGISVTFAATTGHTANDYYEFGYGAGSVNYSTNFLGADFTQYETVTGGTSGATAIVGYSRLISGQLILTDISGQFLRNETITGGTSGETAQLVAPISFNDSFTWTDDGGATNFPHTPINANNAPYELSDGVTISWATIAGHAVSSSWNFSVAATNITKLLFTNEVGTNNAVLGDLSNSVGAAVPNYVSVDLLNNQVRINGNQVAIGDTVNAQNGTGLIISDSLESSNFYVPSVFTLGDINNVNGGLVFRNSSGEGRVTFTMGGVSGNQYFLLDTIQDEYKFGDISASLNSNSLRIDDSANIIRLGNGSNDIILNANDVTVDLPNGQIRSKVTVVGYGTTTNLVSSDYDIEISGSSGAATVNLPTGTTSPVGTEFIISDLGANCSVDNITIDAGASNFIVAGSSAQTYVMSSDGEVAVLKKVSATQWKVQ